MVGPEHFRAIGSDSTGNTTLGRNLTHAEFRWIFVLPDPCHEFNNLSKDIGSISWFKDVSDSPTPSRHHVLTFLDNIWDKTDCQALQEI